MNHILARRSLSLVAVLAICLSLLAGAYTPVSGLADAIPSIPATRVTLSSGNFTLQPGQAKNLTARLTPAASTDSIVWSSTNEAVATIDNGQVRGIADGQSIITATSTSGRIASVRVTVKTIAVKSVSISKTSATISPNYAFTLRASISPSSATYKTIVWSSTTPSVASVDPAGNVTGHTIGTTQIIATASNGRRAVCRLSVKYIPVSSVKLNKSSATVGLYSQYQLIPSISPATAYNKALTWTSSNPAVATVDENGLVTGVAGGSATIRATAADGSKKSGTCKVTVKVIPISSVTVNPGTVFLDVNGSTTLSASVLPLNASEKNVIWTSLDPSIVSVDENGTVRAHRSGFTSIIATGKNSTKSGECIVRVRSGKPVYVTISAIGDIILGGDPKRGTAAKFEKYFNERNRDYASFFKNVYPKLASDDVTIASLESVLTTSSGAANKKYIFRGSPEYSNILPASSIEVVSLANNHSMDYGVKGYEDTKRALSNAGVLYSGGKGQPVVYTTKGIKIGFIGYCSKEVSVTTLRNAVANLRKTCDVVVVSLHWTDVPEYQYTVTANMKKYARAAVDAGADLVLGHHQHVLSGIERYKEKNIVYGLGNFLIVGTGGDWDTFIFRQSFAVDAGFAEDSGIEVIPCQIASEPKPAENNIQPTTVSGSEAARIIDKIKYYSIGLEPANF